MKKFKFIDLYKTLCPWADVVSSGTVRPDELTDAAVEILRLRKEQPRTAPQKAKKTGKER